jgi:hypothetical protein
LGTLMTRGPELDAPELTLDELAAPELDLDPPRGPELDAPATAELALDELELDELELDELAAPELLRGPELDTPAAGADDELKAEAMPARICSALTRPNLPIIASRSC